MPSPQVRLELEDYDVAPSLLDMILHKNYAMMDALSEDDDLEGYYEEH